MNKIKLFSLFVCFTILFFGCKNSNNSRNIFYINYVCKNDTLLEVLNKATAGKASYFDNEKQLQILSLNYITGEHPNTHYFKVNNELPSKPDLYSTKYEIVFNGSMINDSIAYSLKKYIYLKDGWQKKSDMGIIKVFNYPTKLDKNLRIIKNSVASTVLRTIAADTYSK